MNFLKYSLLRFALLVLAFLLSMWLGVGLVLSGVAAVAISFAVSYLFSFENNAHELRTRDIIKRIDPDLGLIFFNAGNPQPLAFLHRPHKLAGFQQRQRHAAVQRVRSQLGFKLRQHLLAFFDHGIELSGVCRHKCTPH